MLRKIGNLDNNIRDLIDSAYKNCLDYLGQDQYNNIIAKKTVSWINLWQYKKEDSHNKLLFRNIDNLCDWIFKYVAEKFENTLKAFRIQYIINPTGSKAQRWHIDYNRDFSALFIPLTPLDINNSTQFITLPKNLDKKLYSKATENPHYVDVEYLKQNCESLIISQLSCPAFSILYMEPGTIHRGVANIGQTRPMLCIELLPSSNITQLEIQDIVVDQDTSILRQIKLY